jgi:hypothetical protein
VLLDEAAYARRELQLVRIDWHGSAHLPYGFGEPSGIFGKRALVDLAGRGQW